jgi:hypothetical protein
MSDHIPEILDEVDRRRPRAVIFVVIGVVVGALVAIGFLKAAGALDPAAEATTASMQTDLEYQLSMHLPKSFSATCQEDDPDGLKVHAYATVLCAPEDGIQAEYATFHDAESLREQLRNDRDLAMKPNAAPTEACGRAVRGVVTWYLPADANESESMPTPRSTEPPRGSTIRGKAVCYVVHGTAVVAWYDSDTHIYAIAKASSELQDTLFAWWLQQAGPIHPRMSGQMSDGASADMSGSPTMQ